MREFELKIIDINSNPKRKGEVKILGIPVIPGKRIRWYERSTEARRIKQGSQDAYLTGKVEIKRKGNQIAAAIKKLGEQARADLEVEKVKLNFEAYEERKADRLWIRHLKIQYGSTRKAEEEFLRQHGLSPEASKGHTFEELTGIKLQRGDDLGGDLKILTPEVK